MNITEHLADIETDGGGGGDQNRAKWRVDTGLISDLVARNTTPSKW